MFNTLRRGIAAALLGITVGCGGITPSAPTPAAPVTPAPVVLPATYTVTSGASLAAPGSELTVDWTASTGYAFDVISFSRVGDPNGVRVWAQYTSGSTFGTFRLIAPAQAGPYEFRYLVEDDTAVARSNLVTIQ